MNTLSLVRQSVTFEVAIEALASYLGWLDRSIREETLQAEPNEVRLLALQAQRAQIVHERKQITPQRMDLIGKCVYVYGPIVKSLSR